MLVYESGDTRYQWVPLLYVFLFLLSTQVRSLLFCETYCAVSIKKLFEITYSLSTNTGYRYNVVRDISQKTSPETLSLSMHISVEDYKYEQGRTHFKDLMFILSS